MWSPRALALSLGLIATPLFAGLQEGAPLSALPQQACSSATHGQFDFWVGDWVVIDRATGKPAGMNRIEKILDGCALLESWTGATDSRGRSLTFYDAARARWHQTWIDSSGSPLYLEGNQAAGAITLEGESPGGSGGGTLRHRISWSPDGQGRVRQHWQSSEDGGKSWSEVFDGLYVRVGEKAT